MIEVSLTCFIIYAICAFIYWISCKKSFKENVAPHKRIARQIWGYCILLIGVAIIMVNSPHMSSKCHRPIYGLDNYPGLYFPYGHYSDLRIGNISDESRIKDISGGFHFEYEYVAHFLGQRWEELDEPDYLVPYRSHLRSLITYDSDSESETYGHGAILHVFDLTEDVIENKGDENKAYDKLIKMQLNDSSAMQKSQILAPYKAISTPTFLTITPGDDNPPIFKKYITIFANSRAYAFIFFVDKEVKIPEETNAFDMLDNEFNTLISKLDLHSYSEWEKAEAEYNNNLNIQSWIFIALYIICIIGALLFAIRYLLNIGTINPTAAKVCKVLSNINIVSLSILGISFIIAFCTIHHEYIRELYDYQFESYIDTELAAKSVLCYGMYFLMLIIPTNVAYIKSYTKPKPKGNSASAKNSFVYWLVRPFVLITKLISRISKSVREEYHKQLSDMNKD